MKRVRKRVRRRGLGGVWGSRVDRQWIVSVGMQRARVEVIGFREVLTV